LFLAEQRIEEDYSPQLVHQEMLIKLPDKRSFHRCRQKIPHPDNQLASLETTTCSYINHNINMGLIDDKTVIWIPHVKATLCMVLTPNLGRVRRRQFRIVYSTALSAWPRADVDVDLNVGGHARSIGVGTMPCRENEAGRAPSIVMRNPPRRNQTIRRFLGELTHKAVVPKRETPARWEGDILCNLQPTHSMVDWSILQTNSCRTSL
jgi:hypothetical protein